MDVSIGRRQGAEPGKERDVERTHSVYVARGTYKGKRVVLYVGSTSRGMTRFHEHAANTEWWTLMTTTSWHHRKTRQAALKTERRLIEQLCPVFNVTGNGNGKGV